MTRKNAIKKNKEKGKTDPIWETNEIQIQNRLLRSVSHKAATLEMQCLGTSGDTPLLCSRISVTLEHPGL